MALPDETKTWVYIGECSDSQHWWRAEHNGIKHLGVGGRSKPPGFPTNSIAVGAGGAGKEVAEMCARYDRLLALGWVEVDRNETHVLYEAADSEVDASVTLPCGFEPYDINRQNFQYERGAISLGKTGWRLDATPGLEYDYIPRDELAKAPESKPECEACGTALDPRDAIPSKRYIFCDGFICSACTSGHKLSFEAWSEKMLERIAARRSKTSTPPAGAPDVPESTRVCVAPDSPAGGVEPRCVSCRAPYKLNDYSADGSCGYCRATAQLGGIEDRNGLKSPAAFPDRTSQRRPSKHDAREIDLASAAWSTAGDES